MISSIRMDSIDSKTMVRSLGLGGGGGNVVSIIVSPVEWETMLGIMVWGTSVCNKHNSMALGCGSLHVVLAVAR